MSTNGNGSSPDRAPAILLGASFEQVPVAVATHSDEALECVATAMDRVQQEIDQLWRVSVSRDNVNLAERLVDVSHALQRAARLLDEDRAIG